MQRIGEEVDVSNLLLTAMNYGKSLGICQFQLGHLQVNQ